MTTGWKPTKPRKLPVKESVGQRGKYAEKKVTELFEKLNLQYAGFAFERLPDARAAGGHLKKMISDFLVWWEGEYAQDAAVNIALECKSTEHNYRLSKSAIEQLPRLKKVARAGAKAVVVVYFKKLDQWRIAPASWFVTGVPSWDMSKLPLYPTCEQALYSTGFFPRLKDEQ